MEETQTIKAKNHDSYWPLTIIAVLFPLIGLIVGIVYLTKDHKLERKLGEHLVAISILFMILWGLLFIAIPNYFNFFA